MKAINPGLRLIALLIAAYFVLPTLYAFLQAALPFLLVIAALLYLAKLVLGHQSGGKH